MTRRDTASGQRYIILRALELSRRRCFRRQHSDVELVSPRYFNKFQYFSRDAALGAKLYCRRVRLQLSVVYASINDENLYQVPRLRQSITSNIDAGLRHRPSRRSISRRIRRRSHSLNTLKGILLC